MTKSEIENYLHNEALLRMTCIQLVEGMKEVCISKQDFQMLHKLNWYSPDEYVEFARKNLKDKLSKM
jgi:hypothetical protein